MRCWRKTRWCHGAGAGPRLAKSRPAWIVAGARSPPKRPGAAGGGIKMMTSNPGGRRPRVPALVAGVQLLLGCGADAAQVVQGGLELEDRKSVEEGKSVGGRVDRGGRGSRNKK